MNGMSVAGRRGQILWKKGSFLNGEGSQLHYDTFVVGLGFMVPFTLRDLVHIWDIPTTANGTCKAILLRPDPTFQRRVLVTNWCGWAALGLLVASPFLWRSIHGLLGMLAVVAAVGCAAVAIVCSRNQSRLRDIRLVLGPHTWGSSDPATWHEGIRAQVVAPRAARQVGSFAELAQQAIGEGNWGAAMWAARLCVGVEDEAVGERLTDDILRRDEVVQRLRRVRSHPERRDREFGSPLPLEQWINCDTSDYILGIG
jgi:hypothetical protein